MVKRPFFGNVLFFPLRDLMPLRALVTTAGVFHVLPHPAAKHAIAARKTS